jgi:hypothetical protein
LGKNYLQKVKSDCSSYLKKPWAYMDGGDSANAFIQDGIPYVGSKVTSFQNFNQHTIHIFVHVLFTPHPNNANIFNNLICTHPQTNNQ